MFYKFSNLFFVLTFLFLSVACVRAQADASDPGLPNGRFSREDYPTGIKESLAKNRIDRVKKDYQELIQNGDEAAKLSETLEKSFAQNNRLSNDDQKILDRLEKLAKKIRRELGANDAEEIDDQYKPASMPDALKYLQTSTISLTDELKKTTRYSVSVVAIQNSNSFLRIVRFIRNN